MDPKQIFMRKIKMGVKKNYMLSTKTFKKQKKFTRKKLHIEKCTFR